jgi:phospholipid-binding lipoprotein MlaA
MRRFWKFAAIFAVFGVSACTSSQQDANGNLENDPFQTTNRKIFDLDQKLDAWTLKPTAAAYTKYVPGAIREPAHNLLANLDLPKTFANDLLQFEPQRAGQTVSRFVINSSLGVGGLFDVATDFGIPAHTEDFGQTLAVWGIGEGPYLVFPLFGPDPPRDAFGQIVDFFFDPTVYIHMKQHPWWVLGREYATFVDVRARNMETVEDVERSSLDYYATTRSLYRQYRANEIRNGRDAPPAP